MRPWLALTALLAAPALADSSPAPAYDARWSRITAGPDGCWDVSGRADWVWEGGRLGSNRGGAAFVARFDGGVWQEVVVRSLGEDRRTPDRTTTRVYPHDQRRFAPLVGRIPTRLLDVDEPSSAFAATFAALDPKAFDTDVENDEARGGVVLTRTVNLDGHDVTMDVLFPGGGSAPVSLDATFDDGFALPDLRMSNVLDARARVRAHEDGGHVFPDAESFTFRGRSGGQLLEVAQTIKYSTWRACDVPNDTETKPLGADGTAPAAAAPAAPAAPAAR